MKSIMKACLAVVLGAFSVVSCLDETMQVTPDVPEGTVSYTAYVDGQDTKAELDGNVSMWKGAAKADSLRKPGLRQLQKSARVF